MPRPNTSVATHIRLLNSLNSLYRLILCSSVAGVGRLRGHIPLLLADTRMHSYTWEITFAQQFVQFCSSQGAFDKDDDLIELEGIEEFVEFPVLLCFAKLDIVLLQTVQCEFCLVVDINLQRILHELLAYGANVLSQCSTEHHDLLLSRGSAENILNVASHIWMPNSALELVIFYLDIYRFDPTFCHTRPAQRP